MKLVLTLFLSFLFLISLISAWNFETITTSTGVNVNIYDNTAGNFTSLKDVPNSYSGATGQCAVVNAGETGLIFDSCAAAGSGDITSVIAGSGLLGGGTTGSVTLNVSADTCIAGEYSTYSGTSFTCSVDIGELWTANYSLYNSSWSSTYNSTYDAYNSTGLIKDWNSTGFIINWSGNYLTSESDPKWSANYTAYNTSWSSTYNSTYDAYNSTGLIKDWNSTGYIKDWLASLLGYNYWNSTFATFNKTYADTLYSTINEPLWSANYTTYNTSWSSITNTSYYLVTNPFSFYNSTTIGNLPNTNNYWNNTFADFNKTYSDTLYILLLDLPLANKTSPYCGNITGAVSNLCTITGAGGETDPLWSANYTAYNTSWSSITNTSYYLATNPFGFWNSTFATFNKTYADTLYSTINEPLWSANYTAYNTSWSSITNTSYYLNTNPFSFWNSTFATFNKTYADTLYCSVSEPLWTGNYSSVINETKWTGNYSLYNSSWSSITNTSYLEKAGGTMTGNITLGSQYILNATGGAYIQHNGTGWVIKG